MLHELTGFLNKEFAGEDYRVIENPPNDTYLFQSFTELYKQVYGVEIKPDAATTELLFPHCGEIELKRYKEDMEKKFQINPLMEVALEYQIKKEQGIFDKADSYHRITKIVRNDIILSDFKSLDIYWHQFRDIYYEPLKMRHKRDRFKDFLYRVWDGIYHAKRLVYLHHLEANQKKLKQLIENAPQPKTILAAGLEVNILFQMIKKHLEDYFDYDGIMPKLKRSNNDKVLIPALYKALEKRGWLLKKVGNNSFKTFIQLLGFEREDATLNAYLEPAKFKSNCQKHHDVFYGKIPIYQAK